MKNSLESHPDVVEFKAKLRVLKEDYEAELRADIQRDPEWGEQLYQHLLKEAPNCEAFRRRLFGK